MKKIVFSIMLPDGSIKEIASVEVPEDLAETAQAVADSMLEASKTSSEEIKSKDEENETKISKLEDENKALDTKVNELQAKVDTNPVKANDSKAIQALALDLAGVMTVAKDCSITTTGKDSLTIKKEIIALASPELALDGKNAEYVGYAYDNVVAQIEKADGSFLKGLDIKTTDIKDKENLALDTAKNGFKSKYGEQ